MRRLHLLLIALLVLAFAAAPARAEVGTAAATTTPATSTSTTPTKPPKPTPQGGRLTVKWLHAVRLRGKPLGLVGRSLFVRGRMSHFVAGQRALVRVFRDGRLVSRTSVPIRGAGHGRGAFTVRFTPRRTGRFGVAAVHKGTAAQHRTTARGIRLRAYRGAARYGQTGTVVRLLQDRLARNHYAVRRSGWFDGYTSRALLAFRKVNGMRRTSALNGRILRMLLAGRGQFRARFPGHGRHVEGDISRQVLALINPGGRVYRVYHMSSGKPSTPTVLGSFHFYRKDLGTNSHGMVHSSYFIRGYAIHGYASVPVFNASHGCLRVPIPSALSIFRWVRIGERIDVYR